jgi:imidazolonepropionase-like amidohydrolase
MTRVRFFVAAALLVTLGSSGAFAQRPGGGTLVLRGGLLIDGTGAAPVANSVVVITDGKIQSVGREGSVTIPANATVIDAAGKTIIPGLVDSHIHLRNYQPQAYLYWGVTAAGDLGNSPGWVVAYRDAVQKGRAAGPYIMVATQRFNAPAVPGGPGFASRTDSFLTGNLGTAIVTDSASAEKAVAEVKKLGVDAIKLFQRMEPPLMKITVDAAHKQGFLVFAHYTSANARQGLVLGVEDIIDTGINTMVHLFGLIKDTAPKEVVDRLMRGDQVQAWHLMDTGKFPAIAQKLVDRRMFVNPTIGSQFEKASKYREGIDRLNVAFVASPIAAGLPKVIRDRYAAAFKPAPPAGAQELAEGYRRAGMFVKEFVNRGGKIIAGSDAGAGRLGTAGLALHEEMHMLTEIGLTPMQVIQSATSWGTEAWGKANEAGTLTPGKRADVVVLNRNPLDDITATTDIFQIIQGGSVVDRQALANWKEAVPKPGLVQENFANPALHVPFIDYLSPELISTNQRNAELTISGENFSRDSFVLLNDRIVRATPQGTGELRISVPSGLFREPGVYPLVVVQPGSGGGVSNTYYLMVTSN